MSALKRISAWILFLAVLFQTSSMALFVVSFHINRSYIARELCLNRNRPELQCNGRCILMQGIKKRLHQTDKKAAEHLQLVFEQSVMADVAPAEPWPLLSPSVAVVTHTQLDVYLLPFSQMAYTSIFHPPAV